MDAAAVLLGQEAAPGVEWPVAGDAEGASFVGGGHGAEQQLGARQIERAKPGSSMIIRSARSTVSMILAKLLSAMAR